MGVKEFKLGVFIFGALVIFILGIFSITDFKAFNPGYTIKVLFDFGDGIKSSAPVRVSGIDAGEVKKVSFIDQQGKTKILVHALIRRGIKIPRGSEAFVNNLGILGEKYLEIIPAQESQGYLENGAMIVGNDSLPIYKMGQFARETLDRLSGLLESLESVLGEEEVTVSLKNFVGNLEDVSFNLKSLTQDLRESRGTVGKLIYEDSLYKELEAFVRDLKTHPWKLLHKSK